MGWDKMYAITSALESQGIVEVELGDVVYQISGVNQTTQIIPLGIEEDGSKRRFAFTVNFRVTIREV
jgi:hypothetical protein